MKGHTELRRRLLTLLAGFFGFVITVVLSAIPGTAVAGVVRVGGGESANAAGTGGPAATVSALDRSRGPGSSHAAALTGTPGGRGATVPSRTFSAGAPVVRDEAVSATDGRGAPGTVSVQAGGAGSSAVVPAVVEYLPPGPPSAAVVAARAVTPSAVLASAVGLRGPPSHTGS
ncbi:hypothetical protein NE235_03900 [Actinoallomurus spadix]|uniref:Uncharacterized protein n=1 Tax=Actinoallomurus spadix TaxID=79912 RepID=A0ABN0XN08_9ACTN|nr:hypothetical protein [Actinoallomurus spadix]MCO5985248.1 hypothetical protein [Actinoallomurus spadix]